MLDVAISLHTWILLLSKYGEGVANYSHTYEYTHTHKKKQQKRKKKEKGVGGRKKEQNQKKKKEEKERERGKEKRRTKKEGGNGVGKVEERGYWGGQDLIDWFCFYYFVRNGLVALLEAQCARIFFFRFVNIGFSWHFCCFVCARSLTKPFFRPSQPGSCAWLLPFLLCADCICVLVCVCLYMCMWKCSGKVINI